MWPDRVSNPGPVTYESGALPTGLRGPESDYQKKAGLSHSFLGMGPGPLELGKIASF